MFGGMKEEGGLTLYPFTAGLRQMLERKGNPFSDGKPSEKASHQNELLFCFCHDGETLMRIPADDWEDEVTRFAFRLDMQDIERIQQHIAGEFDKVGKTEVKSPAGKALAAGKA